jgi:hypothetical protein
MGRRSRTRTRVTPAAPATPPRRPRREDALQRVGAPRRVLAGYLGGALVVGIAVLVGIVLLGGTGGPLVVLVGAAAAAALLYRWGRRRLAVFALSDEDRMLWLTATGLLVLAVLLAAVSAVLVTLS